jgi:hypothetical protein
MRRALTVVACLAPLLSACSSSTYMVREPAFAAAPARATASAPVARAAAASTSRTAAAPASAPATASASATGSISDSAPSSAYGEASVRPSDQGQVAQRRAPARAKTKATTGAAKAAPRSDQYRRTPDVGTPEWEAQQAEEARQQKHLDNAIKSICRGC